MLQVLNTKQLDELFEIIEQRLSIANREGRLPLLLEQLGWLDIWREFTSAEDHFHSYPTGKIVVLGGSEVKAEKLLGIAKELGFDKSRFEFCLDYEQAEKFNYAKMQYQSQYRLIIAGPVPHKTVGTGRYSSVLSAIRNEPGYPHLEELRANQELKITKSNFKATLLELLETGFLAA